MILDSIVWNVGPEIISHPVAVRWYGLMFAIGFFVGYEIVARMFRHEGAPEKWLGILLLWVMGGTIIGARLEHGLSRRPHRRDIGCALLLVDHHQAQPYVDL